MNNKPIPLSEHPLRNEILSKIEKGELVLSTGPIDSNFEWTEETDKQFQRAMKKVEELKGK